MKYYLRSDRNISGPFTVDEINLKIQTGALSSDSLATSDLGETIERLAKQPKSDWLFLAEVQGVRGLPPPAPSRSGREPNTWLIGGMAILIAVLVLVAVLIGIFFEAFRGLH